MKQFFITLCITVYLLLSISIGNASNSNDILYGNLYHSWITIKDIAIASRIITRQIRTNSSLFWCKKTGVPVPTYSITNSGQPIWIYWFIMCYDAQWKPLVTNTVFEFDIPNLRRWYYNTDKRIKMSINTNAYYIFQEYIHYPDAVIIQYISSNYWMNMLIRDSTGQVVNSVNAWLKEYPDKNFEIAVLKW